MTRRAFTLLEVVVAIGIMGVIAVLTFATLSNAFTLRDILEEEDAINNSARVALDKIAKDLQLAYLTDNTSAAQTYFTLFVLRDEQPDQLWFATLAHQRLYRDARESDQAEITIWTEDDPEMKNAYALMHRESAFIDGEPDEDGWVLPLAYKVKDFQVRVIDPKTNEWRDTWDTTGTETPSRLPRAARIVLTLFTPSTEKQGEYVERSFATETILQYADPLKKNALDGGTDTGGASSQSPNVSNSSPQGGQQ
jgi:general secretion pathway protein J